LWLHLNSFDFGALNRSIRLPFDSLPSPRRFIPPTALLFPFPFAFLSLSFSLFCSSAMETIRKAVESLTGDAGVGHTYDTGATTTGTTTAGQRSDVSATGVPSAGLTARRSPDVGATTTTSTTTPSSGREETWQQQRERERVGQYGGGRDELAGRSEETAGAGRTRAEGGVTGLQADEEHRRMMQQQAARQSELEQRTTGKEAGAMGRAGGERGEEKPVTQRIKEGLGMGGAEAQRTEQGRQLGFERGQGERNKERGERGGGRTIKGTTGEMKRAERCSAAHSLIRSLTHSPTLMLLTTTCVVHLSVPYASQVSQLERGAKELAQKRSRDPLF
jgi:hypothetical protein